MCYYCVLPSHATFTICCPFFRHLPPPSESHHFLADVVVVCLAFFEGVDGELFVLALRSVFGRMESDYKGKEVILYFRGGVYYSVSKIP